MRTNRRPYDHSGIGYSTLPDTHVPLLPKNKAALVLTLSVFFMALMLVLLSMGLESGWEYGSYDTSSYTGLDGGEHIVYTFTCDQDNSISGYLDMTTVDGELVVDEIVDVYKCGVISAETVGNTIDEFASSLPMSQVTALKVALWVKQWQSQSD